MVFCRKEGWSTAEDSGRLVGGIDCQVLVQGFHLHFEKVLEHIDLPVRKSYLETACFVLPETQATTGMSDVSDCFHRPLVEDDLSDYFALEHDFTASDFGLTGHVFGGRELQSAVWVALRSLPVGFSWSLYFTPETNSHQLSEVQTASSFPTPQRPTIGGCASTR